MGAVLSLTGPYERFGNQAARALALWAEWDGGAVLEVVDDGGDPERAARAVLDLGRRADLLLGPYSTGLALAAARAARDDGRLLWNQGGSGSHVEREFAGHVISILTPTTRYAQPFLAWLQAAGPPGELWIAEGRGRFARQVARGAAAGCDSAGIPHRRFAADELTSARVISGGWSLFSVGSLEEDAEVVNRMTVSTTRPRFICAVGAGVHGFREAVSGHDGVLGVAQWVAGRPPAARMGPPEAPFLRAYQERWQRPLDYPGIQAVAGAVIATHCARKAAQTDRSALWREASRLRGRTLFGDFRIDGRSGEQLGHQMVLVRWAGDHLSAL